MGHSILVGVPHTGFREGIYSSSTGYFFLIVQSTQNQIQNKIRPITVLGTVPKSRTNPQNRPKSIANTRNVIQVSLG